MQQQGFGEDLSDADTADRPSVYLACKLTGADRAWLDKIQWLIHELNENFNVLPFAFDFKTRTPSGDPADVLEHDLERVLDADIMVAIINGDSSDGRAIELMERIRSGSDAQFIRTLILYASDKPFTPMYLGFPDKFGVPLMEFDAVGDIPGIVLDWHRSTSVDLSTEGDADGSLVEYCDKKRQALVDTSRAFPGTAKRNKKLVPHS